MGKCSYFPSQTRVRPKSAIYTAERVDKHPRDPLQSLLWELAPDIFFLQVGSLQETYSFGWGRVAG